MRPRRRLGELVEMARRQSASSTSATATRKESSISSTRAKSLENKRTTTRKISNASSPTVSISPTVVELKSSLTLANDSLEKNVTRLAIIV